MPSRPAFSEEPRDPRRFTNRFDAFYTRFARGYDLLVKAVPLWGNWLKTVLPFLQGPRVLEVSVGTGYLLTRYAVRFTTYGIDYNLRMLQTARRNLRRHSLTAHLQQADVAALPYRTGSIDTVVNTMAYSGYPDGAVALGEITRVLRPGGRLVLLDIAFPRDGNWLGTQCACMWARTGDVVRDVATFLAAAGMTHEEREIGGWGSVHLYVATKEEAQEAVPPNMHD
jgi:ubiquinone/menaquinone biosynthesis C-methylase UbiE